MKFILGIVLFLNFTWADFIRDDSSDIVTDTLTNLQWQDNSDVSDNTSTWEESITYCESLILGGYNDWRMSNYNESLSIVDWNSVKPTLSPVFQNYYHEGMNPTFWTSTTAIMVRDDGSDLGVSNKACTVGFYRGNTSTGYGGEVKTNLNHVRCVRN